MKQFTNMDEMAIEYCKRQDASPADVAARLRRLRDRFDPDGLMLLECVVLDSSRLGEYTILPYGGGATFRTIPQKPISPRGLASDMSEVVGVLRLKGEGQ